MRLAKIIARLYAGSWSTGQIVAIAPKLGVLSPLEPVLW